MAGRGRTGHNAIITAVLLAALFGGFTYGFVVDETRSGPYPVAKRGFEWARHRPAIRRLYRFFVRRPEDPEDKVKGSWGPVPDRGDSKARGGDDADAGFQAVGYLSGYEPAPDLKGVTVYVPGMAFDGLNLITSGHGQEALLVDMEGRILHRWACSFEEAFPAYADVESTDPDDPFYRYFWRRCHLYDNGDLLVIYENFGMVKLDKRSNVIWAVANGCHHDIYVTAEGLIYTLTHKVRETTGHGRHQRISEGFVTVLDPDGTEVRRVSILEAFRNSSYAPIMDAGKPIVDMFHTNTVQVFERTRSADSRIFKKGNVLISVRNLDVLAVIDMESEQVIWALSGMWRAQHQPELLTGCHILVFDNKGNGGMSKVIEFDPLTQEIVWSYDGTPENGFYSESSGAAYRLPNGNTLIVESNDGRAFEVTRDKRIVWEYYNPFRAGENDELIATLFDVVRLPPDFPTEWLAAVDD